jgi:hypothetical protein
MPIGRPGAESNLGRFLTMSDSVAGEVTDLAGFLARVTVA